MKISTKGRHAVEALLYLTAIEDNKPTGVSVIANALDISPAYLEQIFFTLRKEGMLKTVRGAKGGYYIAGDCGSVTLLDIVKAAEGDIAPVPCVNGVCPVNLKYKCVTKSLWANLSEIIHNELEAVTLLSLAKKYRDSDNKRQNPPEYCI